MDTPPVLMGGILDLATRTSDDIFLIKSNEIDGSSESHKDSGSYHKQTSCQKMSPGVWSTYTEDATNQEKLTPNNIQSKSDFIEPIQNLTVSKSQSPDIIAFDSKHKNTCPNNLPSDLTSQSWGVMVSSVCSSFAETPGDSGVLCLDSEASELSECPPGMTLSLVGAEELLSDRVPSEDKSKSTHRCLEPGDLMTQSDIENENITPPMHNFDVSQSIKLLEKKSNYISSVEERCDNLPDVLQSVPLDGDETQFSPIRKLSLESPGSSGKQKIPSETMKSASDDIVYRRKCKKKPSSNQSQPKKRVSFHEDILNNTKTDNIHIEHGFVSYRPQVSMSYLHYAGNHFEKQQATHGRYSWCAVGDTPYLEPSHQTTGRNTRSDVLTYGTTEVKGCLDNSGIYEYQNTDNYLHRGINKSCDSESCVNKVSVCKCSKEETQASDSPSDGRQLYMCSCSSSDSNLSTESETSSQTLSFTSDTNIKYTSGNIKKCDNTQKSYSCDCIENNVMKPMMRTMYFSDADINNHSDLSKDGEHLQMSEVLPRPSCLKKSSLKKKRYIKTDIIEEHGKNQNGKSMRNLLDSKNLFGSLKSIYKNMNFGLTLAERGVPEGSEDCQSVLDVLPPDNTSKSILPFLSKSFDTGFDDNMTIVDRKEVRSRGDGYSRNYTHEVDNQLRRNCINLDDHKLVLPSTANEEMYSSKNPPKQNLTLDMKASNDKTIMNWKSQNNTEAVGWARSKYIVNCESTVYEHKGVSYCYEYDAFQTTFDTSKDTFTPINDTLRAEKVQNPMTDSKTEDAFLGNDKSTDICNPILNETPFDQRDNSEELKNSSIDLTSESDTIPESADKAKFKMTKYLLEQSDSSKAGVSKHLSSPLRQKNVMRYEKLTKALSTEKENDTVVNSNSMQDIPSDIIDLDEILEVGIEKNEMVNKAINRKTSLINRFLKNVSQKKALDSRLKQNKFFQRKLKEEFNKFPNICFPKNEKMNPSFKMAAKFVDSMINKEVMENKRVSVKLMTADEPSYFDSFEENVAIECCEKLKLQLFGDSSEVLHRMLKVRSVYSQPNGQWTPLLVFITDRALYVADVEPGKTSYSLRCYLTHDQLDQIVIGPDSQYVEIFDKAGECRCVLITGDRYLCHRLVSSLEWCSRNCRYLQGGVAVIGSIPSIFWKKRECLKAALLNTTSVDKMEKCVFYGMVGSSSPTSCNIGRPTSPFGSLLEGFLMYKTEKQKHWRPSFFLLRSGVLSYGSSTPLSEPLTPSCLPHSIKLDCVLGVRRCTDAQGRPHCFEIALSQGVGGALQMAAPDDDTASQWLQGLLMHATQALEGPKTDLSKKCLPPCCTLLATSEHIVTLREELLLAPPDTTTMQDQHLLTGEKTALKEGDGLHFPQQLAKNSVEILSCASIKDLTAFKIPDNDDNWCILEFIFCEVREGSEMGFLFGSSAELERFIATVESLWHTTNDGVFPISVLPKSELVSVRCCGWQDRLVTAWDRLLPTAQR